MSFGMVLVAALIFSVFYISTPPPVCNRDDYESISTSCDVIIDEASKNESMRDEV
jgi:hypothetical protein